METKSKLYQYIPVAVKSKDFKDFMLPTSSLKEMEMFATCNYLSHDRKDRVMKEELIVDKKMSSGKALIIFIALSIVLLIGISLLPKSVPLLVPASAVTAP
jgi:hypothetical protein